MRIEAMRADITKLDVDIIVNAANRELRYGGGVCGAIFDAAGREELENECSDLVHRYGPLDAGDAAITPGFGLPAKWIAHAVGPIWKGGGWSEAEQLASCYRKSFELANRVGAKSIAFPAISTGIYGYPYEQAARVAVDAVLGSAPDLAITLVAFDIKTLHLYEDLLVGDPNPRIYEG